MKRVVVKEKPVATSPGTSRHVSAATLAVRPSYPAAPAPAKSSTAEDHSCFVTFAVPPVYARNDARADRVAPVEPQLPRATAFFEPEVSVKPAEKSVAIAEPAPAFEKVEPVKLPNPSASLIPRRRAAAAFRKLARGFVSIRKPVLWALIAVSAVELILQVAAAAVWFANRPQPQHLVLCVGDSYTFGTGATGSEFSYPSALEKLLRKTDKSWQVVNAGWPDRDSHDTVLALPDSLLRFRPSLVYIVVGAGDSLTRPKVIAPAIKESVSYDFPLLWRTRLLYDQFNGPVKVLATNASHTVSDWSPYLKFRSTHPTGPSLIGTWLYSGQVVRIQDDGLVRFGNIESSWTAQGNQVTLTPLKGGSGPVVQYKWELRNGSLFIQGGMFPNGQLLPPVDPDQARRLQAAAVRLAPPTPASADLPDAPAGDKQAVQEQTLRLALSKAKPADRFKLRSELSRTYARNGKRSEAVGELRILRSEMDAAGDPEPTVETYVDTAEIIGEAAEAFSVARMFAPRFTTNASLEKTIAWESYRNRDFDSATAAIGKALALARDGSVRAGILNMRAQILLETNVPKSLESLIEAYAINKDESALRRQLNPGLVLYNPELLELSFHNVKASFEVRQEVRAAINQLLHRPYGDIGSTMARHLRLMAEMVRTTGAEVVFMSYPLADDGHGNDVLRRVASEKQAGLIDLEAAFTMRLATTPREELFAPDGHLTDKGYALIADLVAADVRQRKQ